MSSETPISALKRELHGVTMAALFCALTAAGAYLFVPLPSPVPITLQTFFVLLSGVVLGSRLGFTSQALYLLLGAMGLPLFAGGGAGIGELLSARGGYLFGFLLAPVVAGWGWERSRDTEKTARAVMRIGVLLAATLLIYATGVTQLAVVAQLSGEVAVAVGMLPFIPGDMLKLAACIVVGERLRRVMSPEVMP